MTRPKAHKSPIDLGGGHTLRPVSGGGITTRRAADGTNYRHDDRPYRVVGYIESHPRLNGDGPDPCEGIIFTDPKTEPDRAHWTVETTDPLTLSPSVLCTVCGNHGFIRAGAWVAA